MRFILSLAVIGFSNEVPVIAQTPVVAPAPQPVAVKVGVMPETHPIISASCCTIPALTEIKFEFLSTINSQANHIGEQFPIKLSEPMMLDGKQIVPAGVLGSGEIIHAAKSRFGGRAGELILAVRYLDFNGTRIPLRSLHYTKGRGTDRGDLSAAFVIAGGAVGSVVAMFITGSEVNIPAGTKAFAKTASDISLPPAEAANSAPIQKNVEGTPKP